MEIILLLVCFKLNSLQNTQYQIWWRLTSAISMQ